MRTVFFGSAPIGFPLLKALLSSAQDEVAAVVTQPDRPSGRRLHLTPCPVKAVAVERGLTVLSPDKIGSVDSLQQLAALRADLFVVAAYGQYIPKPVRILPPAGIINLHPSLLPKYRGAAPIQRAVANGDTVTGATIMYVTEKMDAGDIIVQRELPIGPDDTALTMEPKLAELGADLLMQAIEQIRSGTVQARPQDGSMATEAPRLTKAEGRVDWTLPAETLRNRIRGFQPWPGCFCEADAPSGSQRLMILRAAVEPGCGSPGEILDAAGSGPLVATGEGALRLLEVQPAGKRAMDGAAYLRGHPLQPGTCLS
jgi:methionyl-tRNA formyltransferase